MDAHDMAAEFDRAFASHLSLTQLLAVRVTLVNEEATELMEALDGDDLLATARELADLKYVLGGLNAVADRLADSLGIDIHTALTEVHCANMSKLGPDGKPVYRADGKVLKPAGFRPPDMTAALPPLAVCYE